MLNQKNKKLFAWYNINAIKGYFREVKEYIEKAFNKGLVNYTFWNRKYQLKTYRSIWKLIKCNVFIHKPNRAKKEYKWKFYDYEHKQYVLTFKRLPKCWIQTFNQFYE